MIKQLPLFTPGNYIDEMYGVPDPFQFRWQLLAQVQPATNRKTPVRRFMCLCDCGNIKVVREDVLMRGESRDCGKHQVRKVKHEHLSTHD